VLGLDVEIEANLDKVGEIEHPIPGTKDVVKIPNSRS
jgi:hypothetical protein